MRWRRTHVLHVRKTGGSAVRSALEPVAAAFGVVLHSHATALRDVPTGDDVVVFLRDPFARFVSGFNSRLRCGRPRYDNTWTDGEARAFTAFRTPSDLGEALGSSDPERVRKAHDAMRAIRHVNSSYRDWFTLPEIEARRSDIVLLGLQETLAADFEELKKRLRLPDEVTLPSDPVLAHRTPPGFDTSLSEAARAALARWYADDLALYDGYRELRTSWRASATYVADSA
jgi:hypothetical protein